MELSRKQLEAIVLAHHRVHPDKQETFRSRIKTLQRMGFPPGTNVGRGPKMGYSAEHLFQLITVFELQQIGLAADRAIQTVLNAWSYLQTGFGVAFALQDSFTPTRERILGWIHGRALRELQVVPDAPLGAAGIPFATAITVTSFKTALDRLSKGGLSNSYVLLDLSDIVASVVEAGRAGGVYDTDLGPDMWEWTKVNGGYIAGGNPLLPESRDELD